MRRTRTRKKGFHAWENSKYVLKKISIDGKEVKMKKLDIKSIPSPGALATRQIGVYSPITGKYILVDKERAEEIKKLMKDEYGKAVIIKKQGAGYTTYVYED